MPTFTGSGKDLAFSVDNTDFLVYVLHKDCHRLQFLRELTQNGIEAVIATGEPGRITWDVDWLHFDLAVEPVYKLSVTDTGVGMTGEEQIRYINHLSSSIHKQSMDGNYGVGAKIAAMPQNHAGLVYLSWQDSVGSMIHLWKNPESDRYGLQQFERDDGTFDHYLELEDDVKPSEINGHGTKVVLWGDSKGSNTMEPPEGTPSPSRWIAKYLNSRYFRFPENVIVQAREGWIYERTDNKRNKLRTITGQSHYLDNHCQSSGTLPLTDADVHWWILNDTDALQHDSNYYASSGHMSALHKNELYELTAGRAGMARLQQFGIIFGHRIVVLYLEPDVEKCKGLKINTARAGLVVDGEPLPWERWATEFRENMPEPIRQLIDEKAAVAGKGHQEAIRERLKPLLDLFRLSRYRPVPRGGLEIDDKPTQGGAPARKQQTKGVGKNPGGTGGVTGNIYTAFQKPGGVPGQEVKTDPFPERMWISVKDGSRESGQLEDRAAQFLRESNTLLINADFRMVRDTVKHWQDAYQSESAIVVEEVVHEWIEQALVEAVLGVQALEGSSREWNTDDIEKALSEESLTTVVQQRYHIYMAIKRSLGSKLGSLKAVAG